MPQDHRPLSPHLQIYKFPITAILSILHRGTGVVLALGSVGFAYWLISASYGSDAFAFAQRMLGSWIGRLVLFGFIFALWYHMGNGIRHLFWDIGKGLEMKQLKTTAYLVVAFPIVMTLVTFFVFYNV